MKKLCGIIMMHVLFISLTVYCMNNEYRMINFMGDFSAITIPESRLRLMGLWKDHYKKHKTIVDKGGLVPLFANISAPILSLVNEALQVGPYKFAQYYAELSPHNKRSLQIASGIYNEDGKASMLNVPELTKQLLELYFDADVRGQITKYDKNNDADQVMNYFRARLMESKALMQVMRRVPMMQNLSTCLREKTVHWGSFFLNGYHPNKYSYFADSPEDYKIPLRIGCKAHDTYATHFITDTYEFRITNLDDNKCNVWVIDHQNINDSNYTFSHPIHHKSAVKGCCFSKTGTGVEYVVTYSEDDIVVLKITSHNDVSCAKEKHIDLYKDGIIADVYFGPDYEFLFVATHEKMQSVLRRCDMDGVFSHESFFPFKQHGLLEKIFMFKKQEVYILVLLFGVEDLYAVKFYQRQDDGNYIVSQVNNLERKEYGNSKYGEIGQIIDWGKSLFLYSFTSAVFDDIVLDEKNKMDNQNWFGFLTDDFVRRFDGEKYRLYSPDGKFLLCNSVIGRNGYFRVETVLKDAISHTDIVSFDTDYNDFRGVGFTPDSTGLVFFHPINVLSKDVSKALLLTKEDYNMLDELERAACKNLGVASLLNRLCAKYKRQGQLALLKDDPARAMLRDWAMQYPLLTQLLQKYLPFYTVETELPQELQKGKVSL